MNFEKSALEIVDACGGRDNIAFVTNCATRLRLEFNDKNRVNFEKLKKVDGVMDLVQVDKQTQLIIGTDVEFLYKEVEKLGAGKSTPGQTGGASLFKRICTVITSCFTPIIPVIVSAGMLKAVLALLTTFSLIDKSGTTYRIFAFIADSGLYFLPVYIAATAAKVFNTNMFLAMALGCILIHPDFKALVSAGDPISFLKIPVTPISYSGSVLPSIMMVWLLSKADPFFKKVIPKVFRYFLAPLCAVTVVALVTIIVLGPIGYWIGTILANSLLWLNNRAPVVLPILIGSLNPLLVLTGMHWALSPLSMMAYATYGYEPFTGVGNFISNTAQGSASLAVAVKTKNLKLKQEAYSAGFTALLSGVTEPAMFAVNFRYRRPLYCVMIGGAIGGLYAGLTECVKYVAGTPGLLSFALFIGENPMNVVHCLIAVAIGCIITFVLTFLFGCKTLPGSDIDPNDVKTDEEITKPLNKNILVPIKGEINDLTTVKDNAFASGLIGNGVVIVPKEGCVYAPFDGKVAMLFKTQHAIGLKSDDGLEVLIHIGIDTVKLEGRYFKSLVKEGEQVNEGQKLIEFNLEAIKAAGYDITSAIIAVNNDNYSDVIIRLAGNNRLHLSCRKGKI